jgi:hypothetical protein
MGQAGELHHSEQKQEQEGSDQGELDQARTTLI